MSRRCTARIALTKPRVSTMYGSDRLNEPGLDDDARRLTKLHTSAMYVSDRVAEASRCLPEARVSTMYVSDRLTEASGPDDVRLRSPDRSLGYRGRALRIDVPKPRIGWMCISDRPTEASLVEDVRSGSTCRSLGSPCPSLAGRGPTSVQERTAGDRVDADGVTVRVAVVGVENGLEAAEHLASA